MGKGGSDDKETSAIKQFLINFIRFPSHFRFSIIGYSESDAGLPSKKSILDNIFLHLHSSKTHRYSLLWNYTFGLGIMCIGLLVILILTGIFLMIYFKPDAAKAYFSIKDLIYVIPSGRLIRNIHRWAAHLMVIISFLHMARVFYTSAYKRGREINWIVGLVLFTLILGLNFTGYLLPWDQLAYWACTIAVNIAASPTELTDAIHITGFIDIEPFIKKLLLGAEEIGNDALFRFYFLHCFLLPLIFMVFLAVHVWKIRKIGGLSRPDTIDPNQLAGIPAKGNTDQSRAADLSMSEYRINSVDGRGNAFMVDSVPHTFLREFTAFMLILAVTVIFAYFVDAPLKEPANPNIPENPAKAPWFMVGIQELVSYSAFMGGIGIPVIVLLSLVMIPYIDRESDGFGRWFGDKDGIRTTIQSAGFALICCVLMLTFTNFFGWLRLWFQDTPQLIIIFINPGTVLVMMFVLRSFFVLRKYDSIRMGAIALFTCFFVAVVFLTYFAFIHRGPNWSFYWWPSLWEAY